jgi:hypothetical protein
LDDSVRWRERTQAGSLCYTSAVASSLRVHGDTSRDGSERSLDSPEANWPDCILFAPLSGASWATQMMPSDSLIVNQQIVYKDQGINPGDRPPRAVPPEGTLINRTNNATVESHYSMSQSPLYCWHR